MKAESSVQNVRKIITCPFVAGANGQVHFNAYDFKVKPIHLTNIADTTIKMREPCAGSAASFTNLGIWLA
jgi:hypothetical protein